MDRDRLRATEGQALVDAAAQLAATMAATHAALLEILSVIDERELWRADGCCSIVDWVTFRFGVSRKTANEWIDAARALTDLPHIAGAFAGGELSWDKARAVAAVATPDSDEALSVEARETEVRYLERSARRARAVSLDEAASRHRGRFFSMRRSITQGGVRLSGFLPDVDGETLIKAIERLADDVPNDPVTGLYPHFDQRCADALVDLASGFLASEQPRHGERAMIVAHVDVSRTDAGVIRAETEGGIAIAPETASRLMCDGVIEPLLEDGIKALGLGHKSRRPSPSLQRYLDERDLGCRFPGCSRTRLVQAHHQVRWPDGRTDPDNLASLCRLHHRLMHEGGWSLRGDPEGTLEFVRPDGKVLSSHLPGISSTVRRRILDPVIGEL